MALCGMTGCSWKKTRTIASLPPVVQMINGFFFVCREEKGYRTCSGLIESGIQPRKKWFEIMDGGGRFSEQHHLVDNGVFRATSKRPHQLVDGEGRNRSTPLLSPAKKHQTAGEVPDLHAGKLVAISSNGRGHQLCALEYQEASHKCLLQGCQL